MLFLLDENIHGQLKPFFRELGHDARFSEKGLVNGRLLSLAMSEERTLVTHDTDFSRLTIVRKHPGIILIRIPDKLIEKIKASLLKLLNEKTSSSDFEDKLFLVFENGYEELPFRSEEIEL